MSLPDRRFAPRAFAGTIAGVLVVALTTCTGDEADAGASLVDDWDWYRMLGAEPGGGFEAMRRFGYAHDEGASAEGAWLRSRAGGALETIEAVELSGDALVPAFASGVQVRAAVRGDTIAGRTYREGQPIDRVWLVRRATPPVWEPSYRLWPGEVSDSTYAVEIDSAVLMQARDGTTLMSFVARPVGEGPFPVVMERTPYLRFDTTSGALGSSGAEPPVTKTYLHFPAGEEPYTPFGGTFTLSRDHQGA